MMIYTANVANEGLLFVPIDSKIYNFTVRVYIIVDRTRDKHIL